MGLKIGYCFQQRCHSPNPGMPGAPFPLLNYVHNVDQNPEAPKSSGTARASFFFFFCSLRKDNGIISWEKSNQGAAENTQYIKNQYILNIFKILNILKTSHYSQRGLHPPSSCNTPKTTPKSALGDSYASGELGKGETRGKYIHPWSGTVEGPCTSQLHSGCKYHGFVQQDEPKPGPFSC